MYQVYRFALPSFKLTKNLFSKVRLRRQPEPLSISAPPRAIRLGSSEPALFRSYGGIGLYVAACNLDGASKFPSSQVLRGRGVPLTHRLFFIESGLLLYRCWIG